jgi:hypothetical protein
LSKNADPAHPVRVAEATLEGEPWELRERDGEAWALSARRSPSQRKCSAPEDFCGDGARRWHTARHGVGQRGRAAPRARAAELVPMATSVVTVATAPASECDPTGADCSGHAPGVSVFARELRLVASLPLPALPLPPIDDLSHVASSTVDVFLGNEQLLGTILFGGAGQAGPRRFELAP